MRNTYASLPSLVVAAIEAVHSFGVVTIIASIVIVTVPGSIA
jgi:hypothetical protein